MTQLDKLNTITNRIILAAENAYGEIFTACDELYNLLVEITQTDINATENREAILLNSGKAIGLTWAAMCIKDLMRTKKFMTGIYNAVNDVLSKSAGKPVHILYVGTGPFATLVLPLTAFFTSKQIQFIFLEVNDQSFDCLQKLFTTLGLNNYIQQAVQTDAEKWVVPTPETVDIFINETMQNGLKEEPQVAISMHIVPQLSDDTILIPQKIGLTAALMNEQKRAANKLAITPAQDDVHKLASIFSLDRESIEAYGIHEINQADKKYAFATSTVAIEAAIVKDYQTLYLLTEIVVYKNVQLQIDECALTLPIKLANLSNQIPKQINFTYQIDEHPRMVFELLNE